MKAALFTKNNYYLLLSLSIVAACVSLNTNHTGAQPLVSIPVDAQYWTTDKLGQIYVLDQNQELIKFNNQGRPVFRYSNSTLGHLAQMDVTNPFSILLFYPDFATVIILDRTLSEIGEFNLLDLDIIDVTAVGASNDNNVWLYDPVNWRLKKIDHQGRMLQQSDDLSQVLDRGLLVRFILERGNQVFLNDPEQGIFIFDLYGKFLNRLPIKGLDAFQIMGEQLIFQHDGQLEAYHLRSLDRRILKLPIKTSATDQLQIQPDRLFVVKKDKLEIFQF